MRWLLRKFDSLAGALVAALGGLVCAQLPEFVQQYLQRLGGHADEARRQLAQLAGADALRSLDGATRLALETLAQARLAALEGQQQALQAAAPMLRPLELLRRFDRDIAVATFERFVPALPLDSAGLVYGGTGLVAGWLLYELAKLPFWLGGRGIGVLWRRRRAAVPAKGGALAIAATGPRKDSAPAKNPALLDSSQRHLKCQVEEN